MQKKGWCVQVMKRQTGSWAADVATRREIDGRETNRSDILRRNMETERLRE